MSAVAMLLLLHWVPTVEANNLQISSTFLTGHNAAEQYVMVRFNIGWQHSWANDAAWVFVKFRVGSGEWGHATLHTSGHTGAPITTPADGKGVFIAGNAAGGTANYLDVQLRWDYAMDGVSATDLDVQVRVFGIEMVHVPQGSFYIGDGSTGVTRGQFFDASDTTSVFLVNTDGDIGLGGTTAGRIGSHRWNTGGFLYIPPFHDDFGPTSPQTLPAAFPSGYDAFYCMKYEISQQQYVDFLNSIPAAQADVRFDINLSTGFRYGISRTGTSPNYQFTTTNPHVACNYISSVDGMAYADWAALRPMSELEYEKACRGPAVPVVGEYAWGNTMIQAASGITDAGLSTERPYPIGANCSNSSASSSLGPLRGGAFASAFNSRVQSGASYYGIMDLSGGLWEHVYPISGTTLRQFDGSHGDGYLESTGTYIGDPTNTGWPNRHSHLHNGGKRGGAFNNPSQRCRVSDRYLALYGGTMRAEYWGFRCVRTAP